MGKGPEFFSRPDSFPRRNKPQRGATGRRRESGKGKAQPSRRDREGRGRSAGLPRPGGSGAPRRGRGGAGGSRGRRCAPRAAFSISRFNDPEPRRNFSGVAGFFSLLCFVLEAKAFESPSRTGIKDSFLKSY